MDSIKMKAVMLSEAKDSIHQRHIEEFYMMCKYIIMETVPEIVKKELENIETDLLVRIHTQLNGKTIDFPDVRQYISEKIEEELKKIIKDIRL